jgi:hypothetical protein
MQLPLLGVGGELVMDRLDPGLCARLALVAHVHRGCRIVADEYRGQADRTAERRDVLRNLCAHLGRKGLAVHQRRRHGSQPTRR